MPKPTMEGHATMKCPIYSMTCKLFYFIILTICCIGEKGDTLDLMQNCKWVSIWGSVSLYGVLALQRATLALVGWALKAMGLCHSREYFMDPQHHSLIACVSPFGRGWCTWFTMPSRLHTFIIHLADDLGSRWAPQRAYDIILALIDGLQAFFIYLETHKDVLVPLTATWVHHKDLLRNKGPTPCPLSLKSILTSWHILDFIRPPQSPDDSLYWSFSSLERLIIMLLTYLGGLVTKECYYCTLFYYLGLK